MAGRRSIVPRAVPAMTLPQVADENTQRALQQIAEAIAKLQTGRDRDVVLVDLVVGQNRIRHGLGRAARCYTITPTVADATFAHALDVTNPHPELEVWITVIGVAQPDAAVEVS